MSLALDKIRNAGFKVSVDGNDLLIEPFSQLSESQKAFLRANKTEIIAALQSEQVMDTRQFYDDRRHCYECSQLINERCIVQHFKPFDEIPRRCKDFVAGRKH
ncbi:MAG: hypothetical protein WAX77_13060 [Methylococcaceae bacterium]